MALTEGQIAARPKDAAHYIAQMETEIESLRFVLKHLCDAIEVSPGPHERRYMGIPHLPNFLTAYDAATELLK